MKFLENEYVKSSIITFVTGMLIYVAANIDTLSAASLYDGSLVGFAFAAVRAGVKMFAEFFLSKYAIK